MPPVHRRVSPGVLAICCGNAPLFSSAPIVRSAADATEAASAKTWLDRRQALEDYLRTAEVVKMEDIGARRDQTEAGVSCAGRPHRSHGLENDQAGHPSGYWESYKSEIAAYELDKLLGLEMIPPTVERRVKDDLGAAVMWVTPIKSFKDLGGPPSAPAAKLAAWSRQLIRAKMFDNLICNIDPNLGNWLVDPSWNLILIDHTRSFTTKKDMVHEVDACRSGAMGSDEDADRREPDASSREMDRQERDRRHHRAPGSHARCDRQAGRREG